MRRISFFLPHGLYWSGLIFFPLIAAWLAIRQMKNPPDGRPTYAIAYLFWALAGYLGIHRFYLRSGWGFVFIPVFAAIIYCNNQWAEVREPASKTFSEMQATENALSYADEAEKAKLQAELQQKKSFYDEAKGQVDYWHTMAGRAGILLALMLLADAALLPGLVRRRREYELEHRYRQTIELTPDEVHEGGVGQAASLAMHTRFTNRIDAINARIGGFVL